MRHPRRREPESLRCRALSRQFRKRLAKSLSEFQRQGGQSQSVAIIALGQALCWLADRMTPDIGQQSFERAVRCGHGAKVRRRADMWVPPELMSRRWRFFVEHVENGVTQLFSLR